MSSHLRGQLHGQRWPNLLQDGPLHSSAHAQEPLHYSQMRRYSFRPAGICSLPVELLTRIFILGAGYDFPYAESPFLLKPDQDYYAIPSSNFQLIASHVCRHWRQVALQTSSLWNILHFREPIHLPRAKEYLARCSRSRHSLDILVDTVAEREHIPGVTLCREEIHQVFSIICPYVKRWRSFHLKVRDHECKAAARQHLSSCGPAPNLETLQLYHFEDYLTSQNLYLATYRPPVMVFSNDLPRLKNVSLIGVNLPWAQSPYLAQLHNLELALHPENIRPPYEHWENMLRNSPDLRTLSLHYSGPRVANGDTKLVWPTNKERIYIESLENLSLTDLDPDYLCRLMGRLVLPGVKELSLDLPDQDFTPFVDLIAGAKQCNQPLIPSSTPASSSGNCSSYLPFPALPKLDTLKLTALEANVDSLRAFLRALQGLRTLEVHFASVSDTFLGLLMEGMEVEVEEDESTASTEAMPRAICPKSRAKSVSSTCPRATPNSTRVERVPFLSRLETFKISGLPGKKVEELIQYRENYDIGQIRQCGERKGSPAWYGVRRWILKWSERRKGKDAVLDRLAEKGWVAESGRRVYVETFDEDGDEEIEDEDENENEGEVDDEGIGDEEDEGEVGGEENEDVRDDDEEDSENAAT
ncbi:hypothetical protein D9615_003078 [Tricholomella constricta]|uniref:F-box domain-containing protein n=1 Tax=Tricholomella constricta TaxID=117010 RepID=A0A8H5HGE0_9AGAR|nr:hypothetical protein D9615_003078 [Tricholomella constricta]